MAYRLYINGNILYLIDELDNNRQYEGAAKSCLHRRKGLDSTDFAFKGLNQWVEKTLIPFADINDKDGNPISNTYATAQLLSDYLDGELGKSSPQDGGQSTGWAFYQDDAYTSAAPYVFNQGTTFLPIPNNAGNTIDSQLPTGVPSFYDGVKITPANVFDYYIFTYRFTAKTSVQNGNFQIGIDIGGSFGVIFQETKSFTKGAGVYEPFSIPITGFTGATFISNGGTPKLKSVSGNTSAYGFELQIDRVHKGR